MLLFDSLLKDVLVLLLVGLSAVTTPITVVRLLLLIAKSPYYWCRSIASFFFPGPFMKDLSGETVVVTGAAGGLGQLVASKMARMGAKMVLLDLNAEMLAEAKKQVEAAQAEGAKSRGTKARGVSTYVVNLADRQATNQTMAAVIKQAGPITILVNNAGVVTGKRMVECADEMMELSVQVNTISHFWTVKAVLGGMMEANHGHIVTISSAAGICGVPGLVDYCASKAGACCIARA